MFHIKERSIREIFIISLILKGTATLFEISAGILLLFSYRISEFVNTLINQELIDDPNDFLANHIANMLPYFSSHIHDFGAIYLLSHGIIKLFLVINLLRNKIWAYPLSIFALSMFIIYQLYKISINFSPILILLTILDLLLIFLAYHEYKLIKEHKPLV